MPMDFYALAFCNWSEMLASFFTNICRQRDYRLRIRNSGSLSLSLLGGGGGGEELNVLFTSVPYVCCICLYLLCGLQIDNFVLVCLQLLIHGNWDN